MLPDIKISLPIIFVAWCAAAVAVFGSWVMLAYPAMWGAVGALFFALDRILASGERAAE